MENLTIKVTFIGGFGSITFDIFRKGNQEKTIVFDNDGEKTVSLEAGLHLVSVTGTNSPGGTLVEFDKASTPSTPDTILTNPIFGEYDLNIN